GARAGGTGNPRHSATNTRLVLPLARMASRLAAHSSLHCRAVFCCASSGSEHVSSPNIAAQSAAANVAFITPVSRHTSASGRRPLVDGTGENAPIAYGFVATRLPGSPAVRPCSLFVLILSSGTLPARRARRAVEPSRQKPWHRPSP